MNPELSNIETSVAGKEKHPVFQVTKTSKYLAMALFIIMPFVGAYIGYLQGTKKTDSKQTSPTAQSAEITYSLKERANPPETFTEKHPSKFSLVKVADGVETVVVENVEDIIPENSNAKGAYSSLLELKQLSNDVIALTHFPYLEGNPVVIRVDIPSLKSEIIGMGGPEVLSDNGKYLAETKRVNGRHILIRFVDVLSGKEIASKQSESSNEIFGGCEMGCYIYGRWIDDIFFFDSLEIQGEPWDLEYKNSYLFDASTKSIREATSVDQQQFIDTYNPIWRFSDEQTQELKDGISKEMEEKNRQHIIEKTGAEVYKLEEFAAIDFDLEKEKYPGGRTYTVKLDEPVTIVGTVDIEGYVRGIGSTFWVKLDKESVAKLPDVFVRNPNEKNIQLDYTEEDFAHGSVVSVTFDTYLYSTVATERLDSVEVTHIESVR